VKALPAFVANSEGYVSNGLPAFGAGVSETSARLNDLFAVRAWVQGASLWTGSRLRGFELVNEGFELDVFQFDRFSPGGERIRFPAQVLSLCPHFENVVSEFLCFVLVHDASCIWTYSLFEVALERVHGSDTCVPVFSPLFKGGGDLFFGENQALIAGLVPWNTVRTSGHIHW
jgi:hypothetical protein